MKNIINKLIKTSFSVRELFETFETIQLINKIQIISFWNTLQFVVETSTKNFSNKEKAKIFFIEEKIVDEMIRIIKENPSSQKEFIYIVYIRDKKRDPYGIQKVFGGTGFDYILLPKLEKLFL